jgi:hypothetical protein
MLPLGLPRTKKIPASAAADAYHAYLAALPSDRSAALRAVRQTILANLPAGYEEAFDGRFLSYQVPLSTYPDTYNKRPLMYAALANQGGFMAVYLCNVYGLAPLRKRLEAGFRAAGKKLDMGKSCLRFKKLDDLPLEVIGEIVAATPMDGYVAFAKKTHSQAARSKRRKTASKSKAAGRTKTATKRATRRKAP